MSLSVITICKDESKTLDRFIRSLADLVHEFVIVDTGSTDSTLDILEEHAVPIYQFQWHDDFSAARNKALSLCKTDWCLFLDIDEIIHPQDRSKVSELLSGDYDFIDFQSYQFEVNYDAIKPSQDISWPSVETKVLNKTCLVRNLKGLSYHGIVHESLNYDNFPDKKTFQSDIRIAHFRDRNKSPVKSKYYDKLEEESLKTGTVIYNAQLNHLQNLLDRGHRERLYQALTMIDKYEPRLAKGLQELNKTIRAKNWQSESILLCKILEKV